MAAMEARLAALEPKMVEQKLDEGTQQKFLELLNRWDARFQQAVLEELPQLAVKMEALQAKLAGIEVCGLNTSKQ